MDRQLRKKLEETLREFTRSEHFELAAEKDMPELRAYLETVASLRRDARALPSRMGMDRGREQLLSSLRGQEKASGGIRRMILSQPVFLRAAGKLN